MKLKHGNDDDWMLDDFVVECFRIFFIAEGILLTLIAIFLWHIS